MSDGFYEALATWSQVGGSIAFIIVLVYLFQRFVAPAVTASQARKNAELADAERRRDAAREDVNVAKAEREAAESAAAAIAERASRDAQRVQARIVADATAEGERLLRNAGGELDRARTAARDRVHDELLQRALSIAREAANKLDDAANARLVGGVLGKLERGAAD